jgi:hypothetical protein
MEIAGRVERKYLQRVYHWVVGIYSSLRLIPPNSLSGPGEVMLFLPFHDQQTRSMELSE